MKPILRSVAVIQGKVNKQALANTAKSHISMVAMHFSLDHCTIFFGFSMNVLLKLAIFCFFSWLSSRNGRKSFPIGALRF
jgi:hypothetical protein